MHPKVQEKIRKQYGDGFISWSPFFDNDTDKHLKHLCAIFSRFLWFDLIDVIHIKFGKYNEEIDYIENFKNYILTKDNGIKIIEDDLYHFLMSHSKEISSNDFYIKINKSEIEKYIDQYMENIINDDIADPVILLYSFEKQLETVRNDIIKEREKFGKRRFKIQTGVDAFTTDQNIRVNLFTNLYFLENKGFIEIHSIDSQVMYFNCTIPRIFTISITEKGMQYFDEFDYPKAPDASFGSSAIEKLSSENTKSEITYNETTKALIINGKIKKLQQKQVIFIEGLFDLKDKGQDGWVSLEELAIYDDHTFYDKSEQNKEKIIKNFYNIGNHLNKILKFETGIESIFELSTKCIRINRLFIS